tara:strand:+ start:1213 stop:1431 length:219 start_codon:yes stop_codon:yes gene_type:complete
MSDNKFGFDFGSMTVTRTCQDEKASIISVSTTKAKFSIRATNNGSVRFYDDQGNECELANKEWLEHLTKQGI